MSTAHEKFTLDWLPLRAADHATEISKLSLQAYGREAALLGASDFPPLRETSLDVQASTHQFYAAGHADQLCGAVEVIVGESYLELSRLVVGDGFLRRGVASFMLEKLLSENRDVLWRVDTAQANAPALALYAGFGFVEVWHWTSSEGYELVGLDRVSR
jgi:GNAT superfamily N-acetyltransferase